MKLTILPDYQTLSTQVAGEVIELIKKKPAAVICLASGDTPRLTCQFIAERAIKEKIDFSRATFIGLDEWLGMPPEIEGSCHYFFKNLLFDPMHLAPQQTYLFNALTNDPQKECKDMDKKILEKGGIDLMIVGIGMNGHIGFNEPGTSFENYSHVADLDETTVSVGQKYFSGPMELKQGITLGLKHLMESRKLILIANGKKKERVIYLALEGEVSNHFPASIIQKHSNCEVIIDKEASSMLNPQTSKSQNQKL